MMYIYKSNKLMKRISTESHSMATKILSSSTHNTFETACREIHDSWSRGHHLSRLLQALAGRSRLELRQITDTYREMYGHDLTQHLISHHQDGGADLLSHEARWALQMFLLDPHTRDAELAREAIKREGEPNYGVLVEIYTGRKSSHIELIKRAYFAKFRRRLDHDIVDIEQPHAFQRILVALATSHKGHEIDVSRDIAKSDARRLFEAGEGRQGGGGSIEEATVLEILSKRSIPQLKITFSSYHHIYGHDFSESLKKENSSEFEEALFTVVKCISNTANYFAETLYRSIEGKSRDRGAVVRVMISRANIDLYEIQSIFKRKFGTELRDSISRSNIEPGDYKDFLVALASRPDSSSPRT